MDQLHILSFNLADLLDILLYNVLKGKTKCVFLVILIHVKRRLKGEKPEAVFIAAEPNFFLPVFRAICVISE